MVQANDKIRRFWLEELTYKRAKIVKYFPTEGVWFNVEIWLWSPYKNAFRTLSSQICFLIS